MVKQKYFILTVQIVNKKPTKVVNTLVGIFVSLFLNKDFLYCLLEEYIFLYQMLGKCFGYFKDRKLEQNSKYICISNNNIYLVLAPLCYGSW